jgi:hypothetical protein
MARRVVNAPSSSSASPPSSSSTSSSSSSSSTTLHSQRPASLTDLNNILGDIDKSKVHKALAMLKADRFQLFSDVGEDAFVGVVKSQTDASLFYACRLGKDGQFCCCTQNLNVCGGLRGKLCKHLMVMLLGLVQGQKLDVTRAIAWSLATLPHKPVLDKDAMGETFVRYKGAEAGTVDWRPTETLPEDFYAY